MVKNNESKANAYLACVPHVPLTSLQEKSVNPEYWDSYHDRVQEFKDFDPELVIVFGGNHYDGIHLDLVPQFLIGHIGKESINDVGGYVGNLDIPRDIATGCTDYLIENDFDITVSYAMELDHGFTNVIHHFAGELDAIPVLPVHINTVVDPRATLKRCRQLGEAIGNYAKSLNKRIAFLGSGGLSHETKAFFPQFDTAGNDDVRDYIVHGGKKGTISRPEWRQQVIDAMIGISDGLVAGQTIDTGINPEWDQKFLDLFVTDLKKLDSITDEEVLKASGYGGAEIRQLIAAAAAAEAAGAGDRILDFYSSTTTFAVGAGIVHSSI